MADCKNCKYLDENRCGARSIDYSKNDKVGWFTACNIPIFAEICSKIKKDHKVLEIGCGSSKQCNEIRDHCLSVGAEWQGIDVETSYLGVPTKATRIESVEDLSFPDNYFDFVLGVHTLEHWNEYGCKMSVGLWQCFRACKPLGQVIMIVPVRFHGARIFVQERIDDIKNLFSLFSNETQIHTWRKKYEPLENLKFLPDWLTRGNSPYTLEIVSIKNKESFPNKPKPFLIKKRWFRELIDHTFAFLLYKTFRKFKDRICKT